MSELETGFSWADEPDEEDEPDFSSIRGVALQYYNQWCTGQLDPNDPVRVELLLAAEHVMNHMRKQTAAALLSVVPVKLPLPPIDAPCTTAEDSVPLDYIESTPESKT